MEKLAILLVAVITFMSLFYFSIMVFMVVNIPALLANIVSLLILKGN